MAILPYTSDHEAAVVAFNERIRARGSPFRLPSHRPSPASDWSTTFAETFVAVDGEAVRGGYSIKHQPFWVGATLTNIDYLELPLSEGSVDPRYSSVGVQILMHAQKKHPLMYALGMGGLDYALPKMLKSMGWRLCLVPFFFRVVQPALFLRHIRHLRTTAARRLGADLLAATGLGSVILRPLHAALTNPSLTRLTHTAELVDSFGPWADEVWRRARPAYSLVALRDAAELNRTYPTSQTRLLRLRIARGHVTVGWAVLLATQMKDDRRFGSMKLGSVVDCLALPGEEQAVVRVATRALVRRGVALIVTNQRHQAWAAAFRRAGYLPGPSNYAFGVSKKLAPAFEPFDAMIERVHMTRGDGSGPIHL